MRTIQVYKYEELPEEAKKTALEEVRGLIEERESSEAFRWAFDDCSLFEPAHSEMIEILGKDYYDENKTPCGKYGQFVFKNTRGEVDYDDYFDVYEVSQAIEITNDRMFKLWLAFPEMFHKYFTYELISIGGRTSIVFFTELPSYHPLIETLEFLWSSAQTKFQIHINTINERIKEGMKEYTSDENVEMRILEGAYEFDEEGFVF